MAVKSKPQTRSHAATIRSCLVRRPDEALRSKKCTIASGASSVSPKVTYARSLVLTNDEVSIDKGKQPAEESTDENASSRGNQDSYQSTNSFARYAESQTKSQHDSVVACDHAESQAIVPREESAGQDVMHFPETATMMDHGPLDDAEQQQPRNPTILNISVEINENEVPEAHSIHMTEMAALMDYSRMDEDEEAESIDQTKICVGGYLVRKELAPILREIMDKHNDITDGCKLEKRKGRVPFLEMICDICRTIRDKSLSNVDPSDLNDMVTTVEVIQNMGFNVKWLLDRLKVVLEAKCLGKEARVLKSKHIELDLLQEKIDNLTALRSAVEAEFMTKKLEVDNDLPDYNKRVKDLWLKGFRQWSDSLLYGLI